MNDKLILTIEEAAALLGCRRTKVFALIREGTIVRTRRFGRKTTVFAASVEKALREGQEEAGPGLTGEVPGIDAQPGPTVDPSSAPSSPTPHTSPSPTAISDAIRESVKRRLAARREARQTSRAGKAGSASASPGRRGDAA